MRIRTFVIEYKEEQPKVSTAEISVVEKPQASTAAESQEETPTPIEENPSQEKAQNEEKTAT